MKDFSAPPFSFVIRRKYSEYSGRCDFPFLKNKFVVIGLIKINSIHEEKGKGGNRGEQEESVC